MAEQDSILLKAENGIAEIRLNRPQVLNALNEDLARRFADALLALKGDRAIRAVLIRGEGRGFCAGGDVATFSTAPDALDRLIRQFHRVVELLTSLPMPTVAVLHGAVAGAGLSLSLACDFAIAADTAKFTLAYAKLGATPDGGSTWSLPRLVGIRKAMEIAFLSEVFSAEEALRLGLVTRVVPAAAVHDEGVAFARRLADGPTTAFGRTKQLIYKSFEADLEQQLEAERALLVASQETSDFKEGIAAFLGKRPPTSRDDSASRE